MAQQDYSRHYILSTQEVLHSGRRLKSLLNAEPGRLESAKAQLERAAQQQDTGGGNYRAFLFSELESTRDVPAAVRQRLTEDVLANVLTDLQVANVLLAAGQTVGETEARGDPRILDEALRRLENSTQAVERSLRGPLTEGSEPGRFGFEKTESAEPIRSPDLPSAIETFRQRSNDALAALVGEAQGVVTTIITSLSKIDEKKVLEALSKLGLEIGELPKIGRLFRQGLEKLRGAIDALLRMLGSEVLTRARTYIEKTWQDVKQGKHAAQVLTRVFGVEEARTHIAEILQADGLRLEALDAASSSVASLIMRFKDNVGLARGLVAAVTLAGTLLLALTPVAASAVALATATAYLLILAVVILVGADYADSPGLLQRVRGVRQIASGIRSA